MIKLRPYVPSNRLAVRDSIDEDISDDVDDDVFIKDSRSAKLNEEKGLKRPLMAPRRKNGKMHSNSPIMKKHRRCGRCCEPFCYGLAALTVLCALISLAALILTLFPLPVQRIKGWWQPNATKTLDMRTYASQLSYGSSMGSEFVPCTQISVQKIWTHTFARMNSESPVRAADLNGDGVKDIIFGYGVDDNIHYEGIPLPHCKSAQQGDDVPCEGGVIAVNGLNGELLWQAWSVANVFSLNCAIDIDRDGYTDCVAAGRLGMIFAINGRNGNSIWEFREVEIETNSPIVMDLYTINIVRDLDGDEVPEILAAHLEEREESKAGHIKLIAGKTGKVIRTIPTPFREEVFVPLQIITRADGTELLLIITGGQNTAGGVYSLRLLSMMEFTSEKQFTPLFQRAHSGFMVPAVLADITGDRIADVVVAAFNATVFAFDGSNYTMLWNFTFPASESVSAIVPGHFNHDNVTDFMVKYNTGPGFPVYYYSQTTILDGKTGRPLLDAMMTDSGGANSLLAGVSISQTFGGDFFLHWEMQCRDKLNAKDAYEFIPDSDIILQARADTCRLRYNESTLVKLYAIARHIEPPGAVLFSTGKFQRCAMLRMLENIHIADLVDDLEVKLNRTQRPQTLKQSPLKHPKLLKKLLANREQLLRKVANGENIDKTERLKHQKSHLVENAIRNPLIEQDVLQELLPNNDLPTGNYLPANTGYGASSYKELQKDYAETENAHMPEEYDTVYNDEIPQLIPQQQQQPIRLRTKYPSNRDIRSDVEATTKKHTNNDTHTLPPLSRPTVDSSKSFSNEKPLTLWDLELENLQREALREAEKSTTTDNEYRHKRRRRKRLEQKNDVEAEAKNNVEASNDWYLSSISSTGVLLKPLSNMTSTLDFVFVLNIRESEAYPPLFSQQDLNCIEEKISAYKSYTIDNLRVLRKQFLKQCLNDRLVETNPENPKYESQLIVTRIGITCTCHTPLQAGEVCSELDDIDRQHWTEFMGNDGNGYYAN